MRGAFKKHPERRKEREGEPEITDGLGAPPDCLDEAEAARWKEFRAFAWINASHRFIVERACRLLMLDRKGKASDGQGKQLDSILSKLGLTPTESSKVKMPAKPDEGDAKRRRFFGTKA